MIRWQNENGLKNAYNHCSRDQQTNIITPGPVRLRVRRFLNLAFVPTELVIPAFFELLDSMPHDTGLVLDGFVNYFMTTWVQGITTPRGIRPARYPPASWNQVERTIAFLNKTNNNMEAFNRKFAALVGPSKPNIWKFLKTLYSVHGSTGYGRIGIERKSWGSTPQREKTSAGIQGPPNTCYCGEVEYRRHASHRIP